MVLPQIHSDPNIVNSWRVTEATYLIIHHTNFENHWIIPQSTQPSTSSSSLHQKNYGIFVCHIFFVGTPTKTQPTTKTKKRNLRHANPLGIATGLVQWWLTLWVGHKMMGFSSMSAYDYRIWSWLFSRWSRRRKHKNGFKIVENIGPNPHTFCCI